MQRVDVTTWFTRRQSDARYLRRTQPAVPPTALTYVGSGVYVNPGDPSPSAYLDLTLTPPSIPPWATVLSGYVVDYEFHCTAQLSGGNQTVVITLPDGGNGPYRIQPLIAGATYSITARTVDYINQVSADSSALVHVVATDTTPPAAPVIVADPVVLGAQITISSLNSEIDFSHYQLLRSENGGGYIIVASFSNEDVPTLVYVDQSIVATDNYTYKLRALDTSGNFADSNAAGPISLVATGHSAPAQPDLVGPPAATLSQAEDGLVFNFKANTVALSPFLKGYRIYRRRRDDTSWLLLDHFDSAPAQAGAAVVISYPDGRVILGQTYQYSASAVDLYGNESTFDQVNYVSGTVIDTVAPFPPGPNMQFNGTAGGLRVTWDPSPSVDVVFYGVSWRFAQVGAAELTTWSEEELVQGTAFTIEGLINPLTGVPTLRTDLANQFEVRVRSRDNGENWSLFLAGIVTFPELAGYYPADNSLPPAPLTLSPAINSDGSISLTWTAPSIPDINGYQIEQRENDLGPWKVLAFLRDDQSGDKTFVAIGLEPYKFANKQYRFRVRTEDNSGNLSIPNLVLNPGFEVDLASWTSLDSTATRSTTNTHNLSSGAAHFSHSGRLTQDIQVLAGLKYTFSAFVKKDTATVAGLSIAWYNISNGLISTSVLSGFSLTTNYQRPSLSAIAPAGAVKARLELLLDSGSPSLLGYWDDIQFEEFSFATDYADGKTDLLRAVDTVGPGDYSPISLTAIGQLGQINIRWVNPTSGAPGAFDYINGVFEIWRKVTVSSQTSLPVGAVFVKINEVPSNNDGAANGYDDLDPDENFNVTAQYKIKGRDRFGNPGIFLNAGAFVTATSQTPNDISIVTVDTVPPTQPVMTSATILVQDDGSIKLTWNNQATFDLSGYNIWRRRNGLGESFLSVASIKSSPGGGTVSFVDPNPVALQTYDYTVSAFDTQGNESTKDTINFKTAQSTDTRTPAVPTSLKAKGAVASVVCSWVASATIGVKEYDFQYSTDNGSTWSSSEIITGVQKIAPFTNAEDLVATGFLFRVKAYSTTRNASSAYVTLAGADRDMTSYVRVDTTAPTPPASLTTTLNDNSEALLSWPASTSPDVNRYLIDLAFAVAISLAVRVSNVVTITTNYAHALNVGDSIILFEVTDSSFNGTFVVTSVIDSKNFTFSQTAADATSTSLTPGDNGFSQSAWQSYGAVPGATLGLRVSGLQPFTISGKLYIFRIFAVDNSNLVSATSTSSNYVGVRIDTTPPNVPTGLTGNFINEAGSVATASLSWDENVEIDIDHYDLSYMLASGDGLETVVTSPRGTPSTVIRGLRQSTAYNFKVRAVDRNDNRSNYGDTVQMTSTGATGSAPTNADIASTFYASGNILVDIWKLSTRIPITGTTGVCGTAGVCRTSNVVTLKTSIAHGLLAGDSILVGGVISAAFNGAFTVSTVPNSTTITYAQTGVNANSGFGYVGKIYVRPIDFSKYAIKRDPAKTITAISRTSNVVSLTTSAAHGRVVGDTIVITNSGAYNGQFIVTAVTGPTFLAYAQTAANASGPNQGRLYGEGSQIASVSTDTYTDTTITQSSAIQYFGYSIRVLNTSGLSSAISNIAETIVPASTSGGGGLDCPAAEMYVRPARKAKDVVGGEWLDILVRTKIDVIAQGRVLSTRSSIQPCVLLRGSNGAAVIVSENTPVDDMYGVSLLAKNATGHWLATDVGNGVEWVKFESIPVGDMEVAYIGMGGLTFGAGIDPSKRVFTHNANPGK
jgi:hypothetical protein